VDIPRFYLNLNQGACSVHRFADEKYVLFSVQTLAIIVKHKIMVGSLTQYSNVIKAVRVAQ
jgi:hypothetical protein